MSKSRRQSLIVNNFFTLASIVIISITLVLYSKYILNDGYEEPTKEIVTPLSCEKEIFSVSKVYNQELLNESMKALYRGFYKLEGSYKKSQQTHTIIEDFITLDELDGYYIKAIEKTPKENKNKYLTIKYEILEYDKNDANKKLSNCKFCSGAILTSFLAGEKEIFKFYIDFRLYDKNEIASKIDCTIKVYENNVKKIQ
ncbi:hypothetical protein [Arcobacter aquimarinus]|uniref:Uncharacterized protein n=1 Tax=Arcobacter aquimarinus TaxID=1315211 RepID=A0AAE7E1F7_9BACT|nr:hypothetical protein [Arcobacter aquimarinus]MCB9096736.1 hypothetical protein [Arcobacter sp.]QKE26575.1 hypothetical protein AAQM_1837 [Arcobacter aquimarinus]RXI34170.1 hypothetical protein CP986_09795 [Arcobacter aquimarinus]